MRVLIVEDEPVSRRRPEQTNGLPNLGRSHLNINEENVKSLMKFHFSFFGSNFTIGHSRAFPA